MVYKLSVWIVHTVEAYFGVPALLSTPSLVGSYRSSWPHISAAVFTDGGELASAIRIVVQFNNYIHIAHNLAIIIMIVINEKA